MKLTAREFMSETGKELSNDAYLVKIYNKDKTLNVQGISKNPLSFKLGAKWADLFNGLIPGAELLQKTGNTSLTTGVFSQKYFQGGNNLDMNVEFRLYDDGNSGTNPVIASARQLASMTLSESFSTESATASLQGVGGEAVDELQGVINNASKKGIKGVLGSAGGILQKIADKVSGRALTLDISGLFLCTKMVITDLSVTYSPAQTHTGPLYGDFSVSLMSLQALTKGTGAYGIDQILQDRFQGILIDGKVFGANSSSNGG